MINRRILQDCRANVVESTERESWCPVRSGTSVCERNKITKLYLELKFENYLALSIHTVSLNQFVNTASN